MKIYAMDINPQVNYENMKILKRIKDDNDRYDLQQDIMNKSKSPDMLKAEIKPKTEFANRKSFLKYIGAKVDDAIKKFTQRFDRIKNEIEILEKG